MPVSWSYWRYEARYRAGSDPGCEVCRGRAGVGRAQSPPVGGGRVARCRLRRRRGGFVGHRSGSGDDSQGTPGDCPRRGAHRPHPTPWRRTAPHPAGSTRHPGRARSAGGPAHARRPDLAATRWTCKSRAKLAGALVDRIGNVRTATGLRVLAELDAGQYPTGVTVTKEQMDALALVPDAFHGEWNYKLLPR